MGEEDLEGEGSELAAQLPMMQNMLREFSTYSGFMNARILNRDGDAYIATDGHLPPMQEEQLEQATAAIQTKEPRFSPLRKTPQDLRWMSMSPSIPLTAARDDAPVGALMMTRQVSGKSRSCFQLHTLCQGRTHTAYAKVW